MPPVRIYQEGYTSSVSVMERKKKKIKELRLKEITKPENKMQHMSLDWILYPKKGINETAGKI